MEDVLEVYHRPYDPGRPVVCMDESNKQLVADVAEPLPCAPGMPRRVDHEYVRRGVAEIFLATEPLTGAVAVRVTERRTRRDWAEFVRHILDDRYPGAERVVLVMDNLNTHGIASLYAAFPPEEALRLSRRLEVHHTPRHGSWLNVAEIELSALSAQCLDRRFGGIGELAAAVAAWEERRSGRPRPVDWQFRTADARVRLRRIYPQV
jgi:hypothetical protein